MTPEQSLKVKWAKSLETFSQIGYFFLSIQNGLGYVGPFYISNLLIENRLNPHSPEKLLMTKQNPSIWKNIGKTRFFHIFHHTRTDDNIRNIEMKNSKNSIFAWPISDECDGMNWLIYGFKYSRTAGCFQFFIV